jgi:hypothetical protein
MQELEASPSEQRTFTMHTNLLRDVITRQAGSIDKAVVEGVMNLIEAGATVGQITLSCERLVIEDNGRGFKSREEVLEGFEVFGKSDERKAENKEWAEFQMGRGQLMAFGVTTYRTHTFEMTVDIRSCGEEITYSLREGLEAVKGCTVTVELYDPIQRRSLDWKCGDIMRAIKYVPVPVFLNGKQVSHPPDEQEWDFVTDDAYISVGGHSLSLYNKGVFVKSVSNKDCGVGGTVVSRKRLKLNFARNDVIADCPVWSQVAAFVREHSQSALLKAKSPNEEQINLVITNWRNGFFTTEDIYDCKMFRDSNGKRWSLTTLAEKSFPYFTLDDKQSVRADKAMQTCLGIVFDYKFTRDAFRISTTKEMLNPVDVLEEVFAAAGKLEGYEVKRLPPIRFLQPEDLYEEIDDANVLLEESQLTGKEKIAVESLTVYNSWYANAFDDQKPRRILLGVSDTAEAWTDGCGFVAFDRRYLNKALSSLTGWCDLLLTLAHEYAHIKDENLTHDDGFRERYEHYSFIAIKMLENIMRHYASRLRAEGRKVSRKLSRPQELIEETVAVAEIGS